MIHPGTGTHKEEKKTGKK